MVPKTSQQAFLDLYGLGKKSIWLTPSQISLKKIFKNEILMTELHHSGCPNKNLECGKKAVYLL